MWLLQTSVLVALAANNFRRSLQKSRGSRSSSVKGGLSAPEISTCEETRAPDGASCPLDTSSTNLSPVAATSSITVDTSDVEISRVDGSKPLEAPPQPESATDPPLSILARVFQRTPSSDAVYPTSSVDFGAVSVSVTVGELKSG